MGIVEALSRGGVQLICKGDGLSSVDQLAHGKHKLTSSDNIQLTTTVELAKAEAEVDEAAAEAAEKAYADAA